jgi:single-stranded-DNA-specific exonuclease
MIMKPEEIWNKYSELAGICNMAKGEISANEEILVASHVDADGLTSAGIICTALERCGIEYKPQFFKLLDKTALEQIADQGVGLVVFTDLGSGMVKEICELGIRAIIVDHHRPGPEGEKKPVAHINPHLVGADGATELSGSGTSFLLAHALSSGNDDLSGLAVV